MSDMGGHMLHRISDVKPPEKGQNLTLELSNDNEIVMFEVGHSIPVEDDWSISKEFGFLELDFNRNVPYAIHYWHYIPFL